VNTSPDHTKETQDMDSIAIETSAPTTHDGVTSSDFQETRKRKREEERTKTPAFHLLRAVPKGKPRKKPPNEDGLAGPPIVDKQTWPLTEGWEDIQRDILQMQWETSVRPAVKGQGSCIGLRLSNGTKCIALDEPQTALVIRLNKILRKEMLEQQETLVWTSWQVNVNTIADEHTDSNNVGRSFITALGNFQGGT
jgi:hypothetical protein